MNTINEIICEAVDILVSAKMQSISRDITILCSIVQDLGDGSYNIKSGEATFIAYSPNSLTYKPEDQVYVVIPQGDYNQQKFITGKYVSSDNKPINYIEPLDSVIDIGDNLLTSNNELSIKITGAPSFIPPTKQIYPVTDKGYTKLCIGANVLSDIAAVNGTYGLRINAISLNPLASPLAPDSAFPAAASIYTFTTDNIITSSGIYPVEANSYLVFSDEITENTWSNLITSYELYPVERTVYDFSSKAMYGNPYNFSTYFTQEKVFALTSDIFAFWHELYQKGDFVDKNQMLVTNGSVTMKDIRIFLSYSKEEYNNSSAQLYATDALTYEDTTQTKKGFLRWYYQFADGLKIVDLDSWENQFGDTIPKIVWQRATENSAWVDIYNFESSTQGNPFEVNLELISTSRYTYYRVVIDNEITSTMLTFTNTAFTATQITVGDNETGTTINSSGISSGDNFKFSNDGTGYIGTITGGRFLFDGPNGVIKYSKGDFVLALGFDGDKNDLLLYYLEEEQEKNIALMSYLAELESRLKALEDKT